MRPALGILAGVSFVHLGAQASGREGLAALTQVLLMPALAAVLWTGTAPPRGALVRLSLAALGLSWLGDTVPRFLAGTAGFLGMLGFFLLAQLTYALAFWPHRAGSLLARPVLVLPYLAATAGIIVLCAPGAGALLPVVVLYAGAIITMAILATGLSPRAGLGAALFVISDALIALDAFGVLTLPGQGVWVMSTYLAAQLLLVLAVREAAALSAAPTPRRPRSRAQAPDRSRPPRRGPRTGHRRRGR
ncbi:lysoplasmalogenase [Brachybacterium sp. YJGR34]|uniref:lysoplasmalogenase n=1 Tax=Brachybacterium sp. YJGR34 TaxID=2059911 RepID=UPI000E0A45AD|nr:lysoplasmalogenase [Brachybacterium sp. YJGR34]